MVSARGRLRAARRTEGSAHMSEASRGGHDSRFGQDPQASVGQRAPAAGAGPEVRGVAGAAEAGVAGPDAGGAGGIPGAGGAGPLPGGAGSAAGADGAGAGPAA